ncbi:MAG: hypothetical protein QGG83_01420 [Candidatus Woesearchaeota archaeon]|jgi:hypothetical protein|nr:hypothetical protein [Candidatus Woesearchaeota archaeon]MDP7647186.1 hypothetical protein [Candidatus Woesearchaeota archaeon]
MFNDPAINVLDRFAQKIRHTTLEVVIEYLPDKLKPSKTEPPKAKKPGI